MYKMTENTTVDYLYEDPPVANQKFVCISVLTPKNFKDIDEKSSMYTFKVRGAYETVEEAQKRIQFLNSIDPNVNIYLAEVGKWLWKCVPLFWITKYFQLLHKLTH